MEYTKSTQFEGLLAKYLYMNTSGSGAGSFPGMKIEFLYYTGISIGNPSGNKNIESSSYYNGDMLILIETFSYDIDDDIISVNVTKS